MQHQSRPKSEIDENWDVQCGKRSAILWDSDFSF